MNKFGVFDIGPGSLLPIFRGSKTACLRFLSYVLREHPGKFYRIGPAA